MDVQCYAPFTNSPIRATNSRKARRAHLLRLYSHKIKHRTFYNAMSETTKRKEAGEKN